MVCCLWCWCWICYFLQKVGVVAVLFSLLFFLWGNSFIWEIMCYHNQQNCVLLFNFGVGWINGGKRCIIYWNSFIVRFYVGIKYGTWFLVVIYVFIQSLLALLSFFFLFCIVLSAASFARLIFSFCSCFLHEGWVLWVLFALYICIFLVMLFQFFVLFSFFLWLLCSIMVVIVLVNVFADCLLILVWLHCYFSNCCATFFSPQ